MPKDNHFSDRAPGLGTQLVHAGRPGVRTRGFVNLPVYRGSTVLFESCAHRAQAAALKYDQALTYGTMGGPNHHALEDVICAIEGGTRCQIVSTGLAAVTVSLMAYLSAGDHVLIPDSVYGPARNFANSELQRFGVEVEYYDPLVSETALAALIRPNTKVVYTESPGSHTFEMQDIPAIARIAHAAGAKVLMDNTWGIQTFQPFKHGVDVSIQALTKYVGGHSDIVLGSITTNSDADWQTIRNCATAQGHHASPDDCWLALRGARTMGVRLKAQEAAGMEMARWFAARPEVLRVLHPALPGAPGHEIWKRDFTGACSLFGVTFKPEFSQDSVWAMVDNLKLFGIGASWGGYESLALPTNPVITRTATPITLGGPTIRFQIGLEDTADLIADLESAFAFLRRA